jgi:HrpA-like RNA helicase
VAKPHVLYFDFQEIPQFLVEGGYALNGKKIAVTLPRRIGAISCANRVAFEM